MLILHIKEQTFLIAFLIGFYHAVCARSVYIVLRSTTDAVYKGNFIRLVEVQIKGLYVYASLYAAVSKCTDCSIKQNKC